MRVGVPKEIKNHEYRVGLTPSLVAELTAHGHDVVVQTNAGSGIDIQDADYVAAGARIVATAAEVFAQSDMIVKVKEPQAQEVAMLEPRHTLFTYLHLAPDPEQAAGLIKSGATCIAYETVTANDRSLPLLKPMSEVAGRMSVQVGAHYLEKEQGGRGVLLGGVPGVAAAKVPVLGGGGAGINAAQQATGPRAPAGAAPAAATAAAAPTETSRSATRNFELDRTLQHTRQPAGRIRRVTAAVLVDHVPRPGKDGKPALQAPSAEEIKRVEDLVRQAVGFDAARGDVVSVVNAPFVREDGQAVEPAKWWEDPRLRDIARLVLGALVVLALLFGVLRPALRQIAGPAPKPKSRAEALAEQTAEVSLVEDELPAPADDVAQIGRGGEGKARPCGAYEDRLRNAREAVKTDSKRVAQVVKDWLGNEAA